METCQAESEASWNRPELVRTRGDFSYLCIVIFVLYVSFR